MCAYIELSNIEINGNFVLLADNSKTERKAKDLELWIKVVYIVFIQHSEQSLCSVQASEPYPSTTDLFFFSSIFLLVVLVMVFAICWAPFHIDRLFFSFVVEWTEPLANIFNLIHVVSGKAFFFHLHRGCQKKRKPSMWAVYLKYVVIYSAGDMRYAWKSFWWFGTVIRIMLRIKTACKFLQLSRSRQVVQYSCLSIHKEMKSAVIQLLLMNTQQQATSSRGSLRQMGNFIKWQDKRLTHCSELGDKIKCVWPCQP